MIAIKKQRELPIPSLTKNQRIKLQVEKEYYESKINCLIDMNMPMKLVLLACWDAPVERENLSSRWGQQRFIKKCLKYYRKKVRDIERQERKIKS